METVPLEGELGASLLTQLGETLQNSYMVAKQDPSRARKCSDFPDPPEEPVNDCSVGWAGWRWGISSARSGIGVPCLLTNIKNDWGPKAKADPSGGHWIVWSEGS